MNCSTCGKEILDGDRIVIPAWENVLEPIQWCSQECADKYIPVVRKPMSKELEELRNDKVHN